MKQVATYYKDSEMKQPFTVEYEDTAPCTCCGEPVVTSSMGGTDLCPWCDMGKCRYCGVPITVFKEELDGGESKRQVLEHMKWHSERDPEHNNRSLEAHRQLRSARAEAIEKVK